MRRILGIEQLVSGALADKDARRVSAQDFVAKITIMLSLALLIYAYFSSGFDTEIGMRVALAALIAVVGSGVVLIAKRADYRLRGVFLLVVVFVAGLVSERQPYCFFYGRSAIAVALPVVMAPVLVAPHAALGTWLFSTIAAVLYAAYSPHEFSVVTYIILLFVATVSWLSVARLDYLVDALRDRVRETREERDEAEAAIGVIITYERRALEQERVIWRDGQTAASKN